MKITVLDIGGTSIKSGIWNGIELSEQRETATDAKNGGSFVLERAKEIIRSYGFCDAIGISTAGQVNSKEGFIRYANENIPEYTGMQIRRILQEEFGVPVAVENDVNAAATGEAIFGAGRCFEDFLCITYGTGVGGAIVMNKSVYGGSAYSAGEFGAILIHPEERVSGDPFSGCYETCASTTALVKRISERFPELTDGRKIFAQMDTPQVRAEIDRWIDEIVWGLVSLIHIFNPPCVVLGGGVMAQPYILGEVEKKTISQIMPSFQNVVICKAELGNQAGLLGAAYLAGQCIKK